jgi:hypothetical protein
MTKPNYALTPPVESPIPIPYSTLYIDSQLADFLGSYPGASAEFITGATLFWKFVRSKLRKEVEKNAEVKP